MSLTHEAPGTLRVPLLEVDPDLAQHLSAEDTATARTALTVPLLRVSPGPVDLAALLPAGTNAFAAHLVSGLLSRERDAGGHPAVELLAPGDIFVAGHAEGSLHVHSHVRAAVASEIALLDDRLLAAARHWPRLVPALVQRLSEQHDRLALQLVISHQPRVEDRLLNLFWHLSDRFGQVTVEGVIVRLALTHETLGRIIGARRPTVTLALRALEARGVLTRRTDRTWLLTEWPPPVLPEAPEPAPVAG